MLRLFQQQANFDDVAFHVTHVTNIWQHRLDPSNTNALNTSPPSYQVSAFLQGRDARNVKNKLIRLMNGEPYKLLLPGVFEGQAKLENITVKHQHVSENFYSLELKFLQPLPTAVQQSDKQTRLDGFVVDDADRQANGFFIKTAQTISQKPDHKIRQIGRQFNESLKTLESFRDYVDNPFAGDVGALVGDSAQIIGRIRSLFRPVPQWDMRSVVAMAASLSFVSRPSGRTASGDEQAAVNRLNIFAQAAMVTELSRAIFDNTGGAGDSRAREDMRRTLTKHCRQLQQHFAAQKDDDNTHHRVNAFVELEDALNHHLLHVRQDLGYHSYRAPMSVSLIIFAWQHYADQWPQAVTVIKRINRFTQSHVIEQDQDYLIPTPAQLARSGSAIVS